MSIHTGVQTRCWHQPGSSSARFPYRALVVLSLYLQTCSNAIRLSPPVLPPRWWSPLHSLGTQVTLTPFWARGSQCWLLIGGSFSRRPRANSLRNGGCSKYLHCHGSLVFLWVTAASANWGPLRNLVGMFRENNHRDSGFRKSLKKA